MKSIQILRKKLGLTQVQMAGILGINRVQLSFAEKSLRLLPYESLSRLSLIENSATHTAQRKAKRTINQATLLKQLDYCKKKIQRNKQLIKKIQQKEQQCIVCLEAFQQIIEQQPCDKYQQKIAWWIRGLEPEIQKKLKHYCHSTYEVTELETIAFEKLKQQIELQLQQPIK